MSPSFDHSRETYAKLLYEEEKYVVLNGDLLLFVRADQDLYDYKLSYGDLSFPLHYFVCSHRKECPFFEKQNTISITVPLEDNVPVTLAIYNEEEDIVADEIHVVKSPQMDFVFDRPFYFQNEEGILTVQNGSKRKEYKFDCSDDFYKMTWKDENRDVEGSLLITLPILSWDIGEEQAAQNQEREFEYNDFDVKTRLQIHMPVAMEYDIVDDQNKALKGCGPNRFCIGEHIRDCQGRRKKVTIYISLNNEEQFELFSVFMGPSFSQPPYLIKQDMFLWNPESVFIGDPNSLFQVIFKKEQQYKKVLSLSMTPVEYSLLDLEPGEYECLIQTKRKSRPLQAYTPIYKDMVEIAEREIPLDFILEIVNVKLEDNEYHSNIQPYFVDHLIKRDNPEDKEIYTGNLYLLQNGSKCYLDKMINDQGNNDQINPVLIEFKDSFSGILMAGVNPKDLDDYLGDLTLDNSGYLRNIVNRKKGVHYIDYYVFIKKALKDN